MTIRAPKDFWAGVMFCGFAAIGILAARGYSLGSAGKMGPGYFPLLLGIVLAAMGVDPDRQVRRQSRASRSRAFTFCPSSSSQRRCACSAL